MEEEKKDAYRIWIIKMISIKMH